MKDGKEKKDMITIEPAERPGTYQVVKDGKKLHTGPLSLDEARQVAESITPTRPPFPLKGFVQGLLGTQILSVIGGLLLGFDFATIFSVNVAMIFVYFLAFLFVYVVVVR